MSMFHASPSGVRPCRCPHVVVMLCQDSIGRVAIVRGATRSYSPSASTIATVDDAFGVGEWLLAAERGGSGVADGAEQRPHVLAAHRHAVARARDEPELHTGRWVEHGEDLFVTVGVYYHIGE